MTDKLPPQLLQLFQPRPPLRYIPPQDPSPEEHASSISKIGGIADFLPALTNYVETDEYHPTESWLQRKERLKKEKLDRIEEMKQEGFEGYNPEEDPQIRGDAFKTLFVGRLSYEAKESDLEREFGRFGPIERVGFVDLLAYIYILLTSRFRYGS
jgi:U1 small nuclear ribonucleoprotein 70kDa